MSKPTLHQINECRKPVVPDAVVAFRAIAKLSDQCFQCDCTGSCPACLMRVHAIRSIARTEAAYLATKL